MKTKSVLLAAAGLAGLYLLIADHASAKYEEPRWQSLKKENDCEIRKYPRIVSASVSVAGTDRNSLANVAFRILAGYIFGKNKSKENISMTVPVTQRMTAEKIAMTAPVLQNVSENAMTMRFFMPAQYDLESLPEAEDKRIEFEVIPPGSYATIRFSGLTHPDRVALETARLSQFVSDNSLEVTGEPVLAVYNPPWTLPFLRRNEVWIPIKHDDD